MSYNHLSNHISKSSYGAHHTEIYNHNRHQSNVVVTLNQQSQQFNELHQRDFLLQNRINKLKNKYDSNQKNNMTSTFCKDSQKNQDVSKRKLSESISVIYHEEQPKNKQGCQQCIKYEEQIIQLTQQQERKAKQFKTQLNKIKQQKYQREKYLAKILANSKLTVPELQNYLPVNSVGENLTKSFKYEISRNSSLNLQQQQQNLSNIQEELKSLRLKQGNILSKITLNNSKHENIHISKSQKDNLLKTEYLENESTILKNKLQLAENRLKQSEVENDKLKSDIQQIRLLIQTQQQKENKLNIHNNQLQIKFEGTVKQNENQLLQIKKLNEQLIDSISQMSTYRSNSNKKIFELQQQNRYLDKQLHQLESKILEINLDNQKLANKFNELENTNQQKANKISELISANQCLKKEIEYLKDQMKQLSQQSSSQIMSLNNSVKTLNNHNQILEYKIKQSQTRNISIMNTNHELSDNMLLQKQHFQKCLSEYKINLSIITESKQTEIYNLKRQLQLILQNNKIANEENNQLKKQILQNRENILNYEKQIDLHKSQFKNFQNTKSQIQGDKTIQQFEQKVNQVIKKDIKDNTEQFNQQSKILNFTEQLIHSEIKLQNQRPKQNNEKIQINLKQLVQHECQTQQIIEINQDINHLIEYQKLNEQNKKNLIHINELNMLTQNLKSQIDQQKTQNQNLFSQYQYKSVQINQIQIQLKSIKQFLEAKRIQIIELSNIVQEKGNVIQKLQSERIEWKNNQQQLEEQLSKKEQQLSCLLHKLEQILVESIKNLDQIIVDSNQSEETSSNIHKQLNISASTNKKLERKLEQFTNEYKKSILKYNSLIKALKTQNQQIIRQVSVKQDQLLTKQKQMKLREATILQKLKETMKIESQIKQLAINSEKQNKSNQIDQEQILKKHQQLLISLDMTHKQQIEALSCQYKEQLESIKKTYETKIYTLDTEIKAIEKQLESTQDDFEKKYNKEKFKLFKQIEKLTDQKSKSQQEIQEAKANAEKLKQLFDKINHEKHDQTSRLSELSHQNQRLFDCNKTIRADCLYIKELLRQAQFEKEQLNNEVSILKENSLSKPLLRYSQTEYLKVQSLREEPLPSLTLAQFQQHLLSLIQTHIINNHLPLYHWIQQFILNFARSLSEILLSNHEAVLISLIDKFEQFLKEVSKYLQKINLEKIKEEELLKNHIRQTEQILNKQYLQNIQQNISYDQGDSQDLHLVRSFHFRDLNYSNMDINYTPRMQKLDSDEPQNREEPFILEYQTSNNNLIFAQDLSQIASDSDNNQIQERTFKYSPKLRLTLINERAGMQTQRKIGSTEFSDMSKTKSVKSLLQSKQQQRKYHQKIKSTKLFANLKQRKIPQKQRKNVQKK